MKTLLRLLKLTFLCLLLAFLLRGCIFRAIIIYRADSTGPDYTASDPALRQILEREEVEANIESVIRRSLDLTAAHLQFNMGRSETDPNRLIHTRKAHSVGYAHFFATTCNVLLEKAGLGGEWQARSLRGKLSFLGMDLHQLSDDPVFW